MYISMLHVRLRKFVRVHLVGSEMCHFGVWVRSEMCYLVACGPRWADLGRSGPPKEPIRAAQEGKLPGPSLPSWSYMDILKVLELNPLDKRTPGLRPEGADKRAPSQ